jgi:hypothetical protein
MSIPFHSALKMRKSSPFLEKKKEKNTKYFAVDTHKFTSGLDHFNSAANKLRHFTHTVFILELCVCLLLIVLA